MRPNRSPAVGNQSAKFHSDYSPGSFGASRAWHTGEAPETGHLPSGKPLRPRERPPESWRAGLEATACRREHRASECGEIVGARQHRVGGARAVGGVCKEPPGGERRNRHETYGETIRSGRSRSVSAVMGAEPTLMRGED
jgi:hypothetical protein